MSESAEDLYEKIGRLYRKFEDTVAPLQVRWYSQSPGGKRDKLLAIWGETKSFGLKANDIGYGDIEDLRIKILNQMSGLDRKLFKELRQELRDDIISLRAEASLLAIRVLSKPSRTFESLYDWQKSQDEKRNAE